MTSAYRRARSGLPNLFIGHFSPVLEFMRCSTVIGFAYANSDASRSRSSRLRIPHDAHFIGHDHVHCYRQIRALAPGVAPRSSLRSVNSSRAAVGATGRSRFESGVGSHEHYDARYRKSGAEARYYSAMSDDLGTAGSTGHRPIRSVTLDEKISALLSGFSPSGTDICR